MNQKRNQGYQRTHESIQDYLYQRLEKKSIRQITVGEICTAVEINRSTFYAHFKDVYDVMESIFDKLNEELMARCASFAEKRNEESGSHMNRRDYMIILLEHMREHRHFYMILLEDSANPMVVNSMRRLREGIADPVFHHYEVDERTANYCFAFVISGFFAVMHAWLKDGCIETPEEIADIMENIQPKLPNGDVMEFF